MGNSFLSSELNFPDNIDVCKLCTVEVQATIKVGLSPPQGHLRIKHRL